MTLIVKSLGLFGPIRNGTCMTFFLCIIMTLMTNESFWGIEGTIFILVMGIPYIISNTDQDYCFSHTA